MRRRLFRSTGFIRAARRLLKRQPQLAEGLRIVLASLEQDAFHPSMRTHKLKGELDGAWACSAGYDLRIVFQLIQRDGAEAILLLSVGTHDEVY